MDGHCKGHHIKIMGCVGICSDCAFTFCACGELHCCCIFNERPPSDYNQFPCKNCDHYGYPCLNCYNRTCKDCNEKKYTCSCCLRNVPTTVESQDNLAANYHLN